MIIFRFVCCDMVQRLGPRVGSFLLRLIAGFCPTVGPRVGNFQACLVASIRPIVRPCVGNLNCLGVAGPSVGSFWFFRAFGAVGLVNCGQLFKFVWGFGAFNPMVGLSRSISWTGSLVGPGALGELGKTPKTEKN